MNVATALKFEQEWKNADNQHYYEAENVLKILQDYAVQGGLDSCCDAAVVNKYLFNAKAILDAGAGYGRVLDYLIKNNYKGELYAVERSQLYCDLLRQRFNGRVAVFQTDLKRLSLCKRFDVVLWMWSGISEFSKHEQLAVIQRLAVLLKTGGVFILDTLPASRKPTNALRSANQCYVVKTEDKTVYGYFPTHQEIVQYVKTLPFAKVQYVDYQTTTGRKRTLYMLTK